MSDPKKLVQKLFVFLSEAFECHTAKKIDRFELTNVFDVLDVGRFV